MARETNEEDAKKDYVKRQKANEDEKNAAMEKAAQSHRFIPHLIYSIPNLR